MGLKEDGRGARLSQVTAFKPAAKCWLGSMRLRMTRREKARAAVASSHSQVLSAAGLLHSTQYIGQPRQTLTCRQGQGWQLHKWKSFDDPCPRENGRKSSTALTEMAPGGAAGA